MVRSLLSRLLGRGGGGAADPEDGGAADESDTDPESAADAEEAEEDSNDVWDLIPSWEYDGKYVQSGGHSRGEQERALADVQRQAEEIERSETEGEPHPDQ